MSLPAAAGYPDYSKIYKPHLSREILERFYCSSMYSEITSGKFLSPLKKCGDTVQFERSPRAVVHPYEKNQKLQHDFLENDCVTVRAMNALYFSLKMDNVDIKQICGSRKLINHYTEDARRQIELGMQLDTLAKMIHGVDQANQGGCAGAQSRCYDLGDIGKPLCLNCDTILDWLADLYTVLAEACVLDFGHGNKVRNAAEPFLVLPYKAYNVLIKALSKGGGCCSYDSNNPMVSGKIPDKIRSFHIYIAHNVPYYIENGNQVFQIPAGRRDATGFTTVIQMLRECEPCDYIGTLFQGLWVWATAVLYPEALALTRAKFELES